MSLICAYNRESGDGADMEPDRGEVTQLLRQWRAGDVEVEARLFEVLLPDLHKIAERCFRGSPPETPFSQLHWSMKLSFAWPNPRPSIGRTGGISSRYRQGSCVAFLSSAPESALTSSFFPWMEFRKK